jgi:hypothetical protein
LVIVFIITAEGGNNNTANPSLADIFTVVMATKEGMATKDDIAEINEKMATKTEITGVKTDMTRLHAKVDILIERKKEWDMIYAFGCCVVASVAVFLYGFFR